jgi:hypothetical protein
MALTPDAGLGVRAQRSRPWAHLPHVSRGGLDFRHPIQYDAAQVDAASVIRHRMDGDGEYDAVRLRAGQTDENGFLRVRVSLDLGIEIVATVVAPA